MKLPARLASLRRPRCGAATFAALSALAVVLLNNGPLFGRVAAAADLPSLRGLACVATVILTLAGMVGLAFLVLGAPYVLKPLVVTVLLLSAVLSHFTGELGVVFDPGMIRNTLEAWRERNGPEAAELATPALFLHVFWFGVLPAGLAVLAKIEYGSFRRELAARARIAAGGALLWILLAAPNVGYLMCFARENAPLRLYATPTYALNSLRKVAFASAAAADGPFLELGDDATRSLRRRRTVGILVVGETARADHFSLNGYGRRTNPCLEGREGLINFPNATSSGTCTAVSVPCMFSFLGKRDYRPEEARRRSNVLDVLSKAGVRVVWIENNSGSKGVADRVGFSELRGPDGGRAFDEALVDAAAARIREADGDVLVVLHTMGSHGPAYFRRYPPEFEVFKPACRDADLARRPKEEVLNAYDNTIVYADHVLGRLIGLLEPREDAAFLLYASDHGESLGENGIWLHGLPERIAPEAQTHVAMLAWLSPGLLSERGLDAARLRGRSPAPCSHDHLPHTLLGLCGVATSLYRPEMDLLGP